MFLRLTIITTKRKIPNKGVHSYILIGTIS